MRHSISPERSPANPGRKPIFSNIAGVVALAHKWEPHICSRCREERSKCECAPQRRRVH